MHVNFLIIGMHLYFYLLSGNPDFLWTSIDNKVNNDLRDTKNKKRKNRNISTALADYQWLQKISISTVNNQHYTA